MSEPQEFDTLAIASLYSGVLMSDMGEMHKAAEALMGGPVWTHQLPRVMEELRPYIADFCPEVATFDFSEVNRETVRAKADELITLAGGKQTLRAPMVAGYKPNPMTDIPRGMPTIQIGK